MGRARRHHSQAVAVAQFNSVLGARRGSVGAQNQRDINEHSVLNEQQEVEFAAFLDEVAEIDESAHLAALRLMELYRQDDFTPELAATQLWEELKASASFPLGSHTSSSPLSKKLQGHTIMAEMDDPPSAPGLITPSVHVLANYFQKVRAVTPAQEQLAPDVIRGVFENTRSEEFYLQAQPLAESLTEVIKQASPGSSISQVATKAILAAPESALTGPLRGWVRVYLQRLVDGVGISHEKRVLKKVQSLSSAASDGLRRGFNL